MKWMAKESRQQNEKAETTDCDAVYRPISNLQRQSLIIMTYIHHLASKK